MDAVPRAFLSLVPSSHAETSELFRDKEHDLSRKLFAQAAAARGAAEPSEPTEGVVPSSAEDDIAQWTFAIPPEPMSAYFGSAALVPRHTRASLAASENSLDRQLLPPVDPRALLQHDALVLGEVVDVTTVGLPERIRVLEVRRCVDKLFVEKKESSW